MRRVTRPCDSAPHKQIPEAVRLEPKLELAVAQADLAQDELLSIEEKMEQNTEPAEEDSNPGGDRQF